MKYIFHFKRLLLLLPLALCACSNYQKIVRSDDSNLKYEKAMEYFKAKKYAKVLPLLEDLTNDFRNTAKGEDIDYDLAYTYYKTNQFQLASYSFKTFAAEYPLSSRADEAYYLYAYMLYLQSPKSDLDQTNSKKALKAFEDYLGKYPDSKHIAEINKYTDVLRAKVEKKNIDNAYLYYKIEDYKAAVWALKNVIQQYPASSQREWLEYLVVKSSYELAKNSTVSKQADRMRETLGSYRDFRDRYPTSKYDPDLERIIKNTKNYLSSIKASTNEHQ